MPRLFCKRRLESIENKENECAKERQETARYDARGLKVTGGNWRRGRLGICGQAGIERNGRGRG